MTRYVASTVAGLVLLALDVVVLVGWWVANRG